MAGGILPTDGGGLLHEFSRAGGGFIIIPPGPATGPLLGKALVEDLTILSAPFTDSTIQIPANAVVLAVSTKVMTTIPTAATFLVGDPILNFRFSTAPVPTAVGSGDPGTRSAAARAYFVATPIRITPNIIPAAPTGIVRVVIYYYEVTPG
jgi:hypothetical protein